MCGFTGYLDLKQADNTAEMTACLERMTNTIAHRGPDDAGAWVDPESV